MFKNTGTSTPCVGRCTRYDVYTCSFSLIMTCVAKLARKTARNDSADHTTSFNFLLDALCGGVVQCPRFELKVPDFIF